MEKGHSAYFDLLNKVATKCPNCHANARVKGSCYNCGYKGKKEPKNALYKRRMGDLPMI